MAGKQSECRRIGPYRINQAINPFTLLALFRDQHYLYQACHFGAIFSFSCDFDLITVNDVDVAVMLPNRL